MEKFARRIGGLAVFMVVAAAIFPLFTPGQTARNYTFSETEIHHLQDLPDRMTRAEIRIQAADEKLDRVISQLDSLQKSAWGGVLAVVLLALTKLIEFGFGLKNRRS